MNHLLLDLLIALLIAQLGSPSFREREAATQALRSLGPVAMVHLEIAKAHPDCEVASRAKMLARAHRAAIIAALWTQAKPTTYKRMPWISFSYTAGVLEPPSNWHWISLARQQGAQSGPENDWNDERMAMRLYCRWLLEEGHSLAEVVALLDRLAAAEVRWIEQNGANWQPPIRLP
jgi:hypothetical protein